MDPESKFWLGIWCIAAIVVVVITACVTVSVVVQERIDAAAPVVQSCVSHPATHPFKGAQ